MKRTYIKYARVNKMHFHVYIEIYSIQWIGEMIAIFLAREVYTSMCFLRIQNYMSIHRTKYPLFILH